MIALPPDIAVNIPKFSEAGLEALADVLLDSMESSCPRDMGLMPDHVVVEDDGEPYTDGTVPAATLRRKDSEDEYRSVLE